MMSTTSRKHHIIFFFSSFSIRQSCFEVALCFALRVKNEGQVRLDFWWAMSVACQGFRRERTCCLTNNVNFFTKVLLWSFEAKSRVQKWENHTAPMPVISAILLYFKSTIEQNKQALIHYPLSLSHRKQAMHLFFYSYWCVTNKENEKESNRMTENTVSNINSTHSLTL